jgi:hypothetical protein
MTVLTAIAANHGELLSTDEVETHRNINKKQNPS